MSDAEHNRDLFEEALDGEGIKYIELDRQWGPCVMLPYKTKSIPEFAILFNFDNDGKSVQFGTTEPIISFTDSYESKTSKAQLLLFEVLNAVNQTYRWMHFFVSDCRHIHMSGDTFLGDGQAGDICMDLLRRIINVCDTLYPLFQGALYGDEHFVKSIASGMSLRISLNLI